MTETSADGQEQRDPAIDAASLESARFLARAVRALVEEGVVSTQHLLAAYRTTADDDGARADALDVAFLQEARALGGDALLRARSITVAMDAPARAALRCVTSSNGDVTLHVPASHGAAGDALALACGLSLEAAKLAHGLKPATEALRATFPTPAEAKAALDALTRGGSARDVVIAPVRSRFETIGGLTAASDRPVYVVCGDGAHRMLDMLSPFARRLRAELRAASPALTSALSGAVSGAVSSALPSARDDDVVYRACDALFRDPLIAGERIDVERADGFLPAGDGVVVVKCESMSDDVDRRCRDAVVLLKRARALLLLVEPYAPTLSAVLDVVGPSCRAVVLLLDGAPLAPSYVADLASGHVIDVKNALDGTGTLTTVPSLALVGGAMRPANVDVGAFALLQCVVGAQARGTLASSMKTAMKSTPASDVSSVSATCVEVLSRIGPKKGK